MLLFFDPLDRFLQFQCQVVVRYRLEHIVHGIYFVAVDRVLGKIGHEDDHSIGVHLAETLGALHSVHARQFNIKENDIIALGARQQKILNADIGSHMELLSMLFAKTADILAQGCKILRVILNDCKVNHTIVSAFANYLWFLAILSRLFYHSFLPKA